MTDQSTPQFTLPQMLPGRIHDIGGEVKLKQRVKRLEGLLADVISVLKADAPRDAETGEPVTNVGQKLDEITELLKGNAKDMHYVMGRADPVASSTPDAPGTPKSVTYWSPGGTDTEAFMCLGGKISRLSRLQGISWARKAKDQGQKPIRGSMISIVMGGGKEKRFSLFDTVPLKLDWILLQVLDELGRVAWLALADVTIFGRNGGASIDDIVIDDGWTFSASAMFGWLEGRGIEPVVEGGKKSGRITGYVLAEEAAALLDSYVTS